MRARIYDSLGAALLAGAGGSSFVASFRPSDLLLPVVVGALVGAGAGLLPRDVRPALAVAVPVAAVVAGCLAGLRASPAVLPEAWGPDGWPALRDTLGSATATPEALAVPYLATAGAAYLGTVASRWGSAVWPRLLPGLAVMLLGFALGDEWRDATLWVPVLWAAAALLVLARADDRHRSPKAVLGGAVVVLVVVGAAAPLGRHLPRNPTRWVLPPESTTDAHTADQPLATVTDLRQGPDDLLFTVTTTAPVQRWRLAVLDTYDGRRWTGTQLFRPAGGDLPASADGPSADGVEVTQTFELALPDPDAGALVGGRWLPAADRVVRVASDGVRFDVDRGVLLAGDGPLPATYEITSRIGVPDEETLLRAPVVTGPDAELVRAVPDDLPDELAELADRLTSGATSPYARAVEIQRHLVDPDNELVVEEPPGGHTLAHIERFLAADDGLRGAAEHYTTAFAVLARSAGLPTRIVVGFEGAGTTGEQEVTAHDATAWVEVWFDGPGWVPFDPVPDPTSDVAPPLPPVERGDVEREPTEVAPRAPAEDDDAAGDDSRDREDSGAAPGFPAWLLPVGLVLLVLGVVAPGLLRAARHRRRRTADGPAAQVAAAWAAVVDELRAAEVAITRDLAVTDVVREARRRIPVVGDQIGLLGTLVNRASFAKRPPDAAEAARARELSEMITAVRRRARPLRRRVREYFSLR